MDNGQQPMAEAGAGKGSSAAALPPPPPQPPLYQENFQGALDKLERLDTSWMFTAPVDPKVYPRYADLVAHPMDYSTMRKKLKGHLYATFADFQKDFDLIVDNCIGYHPEVAKIHQAALKAKDEGGVILKQLYEEINQTFETDVNLIDLTQDDLSDETDSIPILQREIVDANEDVEGPMPGLLKEYNLKEELDFDQDAIDYLPPDIVSRYTLAESNCSRKDIYALPRKKVVQRAKPLKSNRHPHSRALKKQRSRKGKSKLSGRFPTKSIRATLPNEERLKILRKMIKTVKRRIIPGTNPQIWKISRIKNLRAEFKTISKLIAQRPKSPEAAVAVPSAATSKKRKIDFQSTNDSDGEDVPMLKRKFTGASLKVEKLHGKAKKRAQLMVSILRARESVRPDPETVTPLPNDDERELKTAAAGKETEAQAATSSANGATKRRKKRGRPPNFKRISVLSSDRNDDDDDDAEREALVVENESKETTTPSPAKALSSSAIAPAAEVPVRVKGVKAEHKLAISRGKQIISSRLRPRTMLPDYRRRFFTRAFTRTQTCLSKAALQDESTNGAQSSDDDASTQQQPKAELKSSNLKLVLRSSSRKEENVCGGQRPLRLWRTSVEDNVEDATKSTTTPTMQPCVVRLEPLSETSLKMPTVRLPREEERRPKSPVATCSTIGIQTCSLLLTNDDASSMDQPRPDRSSETERFEVLPDMQLRFKSSLRSRQAEKRSDEMPYIIPESPDINDVLKSVTVNPKKEKLLIFWSLLGSSRKQQQLGNERTFVRQIQKKEELIKEMKKHPELWLPEYGDRMLRMTKWKQVATSLHVSVKNVQRQWRHLFKTFENNHRNFANILPSETYSVDIIKKVAWTQWAIFSNLLFLHPSMAKKISKDNNDSADSDVEITGDDESIPSAQYCGLKHSKPSSISDGSLKLLPKIVKEDKTAIKDAYLEVFGDHMSELASQVPLKRRTECMKLVTDMMQSFISPHEH